MAEARAYAARNRQGSDWFGHSDTSAGSHGSTSAGSHSNTGAGSHSDAGTGSHGDASSGSHGDTGVVADTHASTQVSSPVKGGADSSEGKNGTGTSTPGGRSQMIKPACNSNQWYKYDQAAASADGTPKKDAKSTRQATNDWFTHDNAKSNDKKDSKPRVVTTEGESYCRRDKTGSSATWFAHEHHGESTPQNAGPRVTSKEGSGNASRMRGESENWFSHDAGKNNGASVPHHVSKGRGVQPHSSEMHKIFHMDDGSK